MNLHWRTILHTNQSSSLSGSFYVKPVHVSLGMMCPVHCKQYFLVLWSIACNSSSFNNTCSKLTLLWSFPPLSFGFNIVVTCQKYSLVVSFFTCLCLISSSSKIPSYQSFPYENHSKCYKKLARKSALATCTYLFFLYKHYPLLLENEKLLSSLFSSAN